VAFNDNTVGILSTFDVGEPVQLQAEIKVDDVLTDPSSLQVQVKDPDGTVVSFTWPGDSEVVRDSVGLFRFDFPVLIAGRHVYRYNAIGLAEGVEEKSFLVKESEFD